MHEGCESTSMILHYHSNFSAQERRKDSNAESLTCLPQVPSWHGSLRKPGSLRQLGSVFYVVAAVSLMIGCDIITIIVLHHCRCIIGVDGGG
jgi:hypothetical protein